MDLVYECIPVSLIKFVCLFVCILSITHTDSEIHRATLHPSEVYERRLILVLVIFGYL